MVQSQSTIEVFCSYAPQDKKYLERLTKYLHPLEREGFISIWSDREIAAGTEKAYEIGRHLEAAGIFLFLVSPDFIASDYHQDVEVKRAMERYKDKKTLVIPVILRACEYEKTPFGHLASIPKDGNPLIDSDKNVNEEEFTNIAKEIRQFINEREKPFAHTLISSRHLHLDHQSHRSWLVRKFNQFRYTRHYRRSLSRNYGSLDQRGLSTQEPFALPLEDVYVELRTDATPPHQASTNPLRLPKELSSGRHTIWEYLRAPLEVQHFVILGPPGSGKTTLLKHVALTLAKCRWPWEFRRRYLPVLLLLREQVRLLHEYPNYTLADVVRIATRSGTHSMPSDWIEHWLASGRCIVLLDGLDEVVEPSFRQQLGAWVQKQMRTYNENRFLITSRPDGYRSAPFDMANILEIQALTVYQIKQFLIRWYLKREKIQGNAQGQMRAQEQANKLFLSIRETPALFALAVNPLLLTMIVNVHSHRGVLPKNRVKLYQEICEVFLGKWREARNIQQELSGKRQQMLLQALAYHMMLQGIRDISSEEAEALIEKVLHDLEIEISAHSVFQNVENGSGLLVESQPGVWTFAHLTFQEYLTAVHIREQSLGQILLTQIESAWWHETIRLYCAQADASDLITACLTQPAPSIAVTTLALECLQEAYRVAEGVRQRFYRMVGRWQRSSNLEQRDLIGEALLTKRIRQMPPMNDQSFLDTSLVTNAEYQLFSNKQLMRFDTQAIYSWDKPALGISRSEALAFCKWLTSREKEEWCYRLPDLEEILQIGDMAAGCWINGPDSLQQYVFSLHGHICDRFRKHDHLLSLLTSALQQGTEVFNQNRVFPHDQELAHRLDALRFSLLEGESITGTDVASASVYAKGERENVHEYVSLLVRQEIKAGRLRLPLSKNIGILLVKEHL